MGNGPFRIARGSEEPSGRRRSTPKTGRTPAPRLKLFRGPGEEVPAPRPRAVSIRLMDLYPVLAQAYGDNYVWLRDFEQDEVVVSNDLFEVVQAFGDCRPSA